ncbi:hypothetical protein [Thermodesulfitimonas sp.]
MRHLLFVLVGTFAATVSCALIAETFVRRMEAVGLAVGFLFLIIAANVIFDIVGTAATAASEPTFNAMAARKVSGAAEGFWLVRHADKVANFTNDIIGDITGTVAGALGISLITQVLARWPELSELWLNILVTAVIASVTVVGKAAGKRLAVSEPDQVIFLAGRLMAAWGRLKSPFGRRKKNAVNRKGRQIERSRAG